MKDIKLKSFCLNCNLVWKISAIFPTTYLCDTKGDVTHIEPTGLSGHLAPHYRYRSGSDSQSIWSHGWQESCGWDLACSCMGISEIRHFF